MSVKFISIKHNKYIVQLKSKGQSPRFGENWLLKLVYTNELVEVIAIKLPQNSFLQISTTQTSVTLSIEVSKLSPFFCFQLPTLNWKYMTFDDMGVFKNIKLIYNVKCLTFVFFNFQSILIIAENICCVQPVD